MAQILRNKNKAGVPVIFVLSNLSTFGTVQRTSALGLLTIMLMVVGPWQLVCLAHPLGHEHHDGPSVCELRGSFEGTAYWPPMHCDQVTIEADDFEVPRKELLKPATLELDHSTHLAELIQPICLNESFTPPPDQLCNSGPPPGNVSLRGPPFV